MRTLLCFFVLLCLYSSTSFAQGNLEPIAGPGLTMKTLQQVEPRTPISAAQTIATSGSYYLTNNISGTIVITASDVALDLNGFTLSNGNPNGVTISGTNNVRIFNGTIKTPQAAGVGGAGVSRAHVHDLRISGGVNCVSFFNPADQVEVSRINCSVTQKAGILAVANSTLPLVVLIHDNNVSNTNIDDLPGASIVVSNTGTNDGTYADVRNNLVYDSKKACIIVSSDPVAEVSAGIVTENSTSFCVIGLVVVGDFIVTKNLAQASESANYDFTSAPNAAPVADINAPPGPWHNISADTPVPP